MPFFFFTVEQQERAIVERFGKFVRVAGPGLQRKSPFVETVAGRMSLQVDVVDGQHRPEGPPYSRDLDTGCGVHGLTLVPVEMSQHRNVAA